MLFISLLTMFNVYLYKFYLFDKKCTPYNDNVCYNNENIFNLNNEY